ncbi:dihydrofolate reductase [Insulibacter thermoxylanivorax]|uniref:Dihydrofolate reductase n=1 Tax=Insulibacter thermoxylanivorax TaxID=2749268 RepID=A0A916VG19_9BACL|nr:dihydrofolate reductase [Insulibacter thermoxylanivorax]GFR38254.1 dihydrofolate reductase [Insulibacter thermoxylanivorax]
MTRLSIIVAMGKDRTIGKNNDLPWHLPDDLKRFRKITMGHPIIMGRKTHESIGKALDGRHNIVLTRDPEYRAEGCTVTHSVEETLQAVQDADEAFVIGGAEIIRLFLAQTDRIYLTYIDQDFAGDVFLPELAEEEWQLVSVTPGVTDERNPYRFEYRIYERIRASEDRRS